MIVSMNVISVKADPIPSKVLSSVKVLASDGEVEPVHVESDSSGNGCLWLVILLDLLRRFCGVLQVAK